MSLQDTSRAERVELILQQLQSLPTLSSVATRLLQLTSDEQSDIKDIVRIIESDPSLTTKVLSLCRRADKGISTIIKTVDRAIIMLGFESVRSAVLSVEIYNLFTPSNEDKEYRTDADTDDNHTDINNNNNNNIKPNKTRFDRVGFWKHCIAVGVTSELLTEMLGRQSTVHPDEAYVCGLLHDIGKIALDRLLPRSYDRVVELTDQHQSNIAEMERKVIGLDHHTAGRRLAEQWGLPHSIQDVLWLHGQPYESLPDLPHKQIIGIVGLADFIVRQQHIGYSGNHVICNDIHQLAGTLGITAAMIEEIIPKLHERVVYEVTAIGLEQQPTQQLFLESIARANKTLGYINETLERNTQTATRLKRTLQAICEFHQLATPGQSVTTVCGHVVASATKEFGQGYYAVFSPSRGGKNWQMCQFHQDGRLIRSQIVEQPLGIETLESFGEDMQVSVGMLGMLPWLSEFVGDSHDVREVRLLPLRCGWGLSAVLLHDRDISQSGFSRIQLRSLSESWAAAIASAGQHEGARRLGEQLAESNRILTETQAKLAHTQVLASLGEMAAGAAHEMNNPLTVISGRSQVLAREVEEPRHQHMAQQIVEQAHKLTDLITSLHLFAEPPRPKIHQVAVNNMISNVISSVSQRIKSAISIQVNVEQNLPKAWIDDEHIGLALFELIVNALEANPKQLVEVDVHIDKSDDRMVIMVKDDGVGMNRHTLMHACDPFFSAKPAGRQAGLGLARVQRLVATHGGSLELESDPDTGTTVKIHLHKWRCPENKQKLTTDNKTLHNSHANSKKLSDSDTDQLAA